MTLPGPPVQNWPTIPFTENVPIGWFNFDDQCVTSALAFTQPLDPAGTGFNVTLIASGVSGQVPSFSGMTSQDYSGYNNTAGMLNYVSVEYGTNYRVSPQVQYYSVTQDPGAPLVPCVTSLTLTHGMNPSLVITIGGSGLNPAIVPDVSRFSVLRAPSEPSLITVPASSLPVRAVELTSSSITLSLAGTVSLNDLVTLSHSPLFPGQSPYPLSAQDSIGNLLAAITNASVTVS
jgi:hypothetical protein